MISTARGDPSLSSTRRRGADRLEAIEPPARKLFVDDGNCARPLRIGFRKGAAAPERNARGFEVSGDTVRNCAIGTRSR
jgi:hypothetical protein